MCVCTTVVTSRDPIFATILAALKRHSTHIAALDRDFVNFFVLILPSTFHRHSIFGNSAEPSFCSTIEHFCIQAQTTCIDKAPRKHTTSSTPSQTWSCQKCPGAKGRKKCPVWLKIPILTTESSNGIISFPWEHTLHSSTNRCFTQRGSCWTSDTKHADPRGILCGNWMIFSYVGNKSLLFDIATIWKVMWRRPLK